MAKNSKHYHKDGTEYVGKVHKMPDGSVHSGAKHSKSSKPLSHTKPKKPKKAKGKKK